jgi:hypothetical protein
VLSTSENFNEEELYHVPEGWDEDEDEEMDEDDDTVAFDDFDDDEIEASLATAARSAPQTSSMNPVQKQQQQKPAQSIAPSKTSLPQIGKKSSEPQSAAVKERHKPERVVIQASSSRPSSLPTIAKSSSAQPRPSTANAQAAVLNVVEKDVVAAPIAPGLTVTEETDQVRGLSCFVVAPECTPYH